MHRRKAGTAHQRTDLGDSSRLPLHPDSTAVHGGHILLRGLQRQDSQRLLNVTFLHPVIRLSEERAAGLLEYYDFISRHTGRSDNVYDKEIHKTLLYALMLEISDIYRNISGDRSEVTKPRQEQLTDDFFRLLTAHYRSEHNVAFYAGRLNRTPKYFSEAIRRISGRSVSDWIATMLLSDSKLLLQTTDMTILEISEELGFSSPSVFVQFFRHHTGTTPLQYRKQL